MSTIDLNSPPPNHRYNVTVEREETRAERNVRLVMKLGIFAVAIVFVGLVAWLCYSTLMSQTALPEEKKWAMSVLSAATGGIVGYLVRNG